MLETLREYGLELLHEQREYKELKQAHALHYFALILKAKPHLLSNDDLEWLALLERKYENIRAALDWAVDQKETTRVQLVCSVSYSFGY